MESRGIFDLLRILVRRRQVYFSTFLLLFAFSIAFAFLFPPTYRSTGTIQLQLPEVPQDVTSDQVATGSDPAAIGAERANERIELINQRILTRDSLADIIAKYKLYPNQLKTSPLDEVILKMQKKIKIDVVDTDVAAKSVGSPVSAIAFTVSFDYADPATTQLVTQELVNRFVKEHTDEQQNDANRTASFLADQLSVVNQTLADQEQKISGFKQQHAGIGSDSLTFNMQMLASASETIGTITQQLNALDVQRGVVASQLASTDAYSRVIDVPLGYQQNLQATHIVTAPDVELKALRSNLAELEGQYGPNHPDVLSTERKIAALESQSNMPLDGSDIENRIVDTQTKLEIARQTYGPGYPDVLILQKQLDRLKAEEQSLGPNSRHQVVVQNADNPGYLVLKYQLDSLDAQKQSLDAQLQAANQQEQTYQLRIDQTPEVDKELAALTRDYDNDQTQYQTLHAKKLTADMAANVQQNNQGERLVVIDPPDLPIKPHFPPRGIVIALGFVTGLFGGFGTALAAEELSPAVYGTATLVELTALPVLATIPALLSVAELHRRQRRRRIVRYSFIAVLVLAALGIALFFYLS